MKNLFTSESVGIGHPDKLCDQIADRILDELLKGDPYTRSAIEVFATAKMLIISGEVTTKVKVDYLSLVNEVLDTINYGDYHPKIIIDINTQSPDISIGVDNDGAGDQGIMFGYASNETDGYMPLAIVIAHKLVRVANEKRITKEFKDAKADMKSQVTIDYTDPNNIKIDTILMSIQHTSNYNKKEFKEFIIEHIMKPVAISFNMNTDFKVLINPTGRFEIGGPVGDTGLTGRKIIVDTYGGYTRHGGGSFSGKDATKVDRSAAYMLRYIAKNLVAANVADKIELQVSYAIGQASPISLNINTFNTEHLPLDKIYSIVEHLFDLRPKKIIDILSLRSPIYYQVSKYGHFGRNDLDLPWERLDKVKEIIQLIKQIH